MKDADFRKALSVADDPRSVDLSSARQRPRRPGTWLRIGREASACRAEARKAAPASVCENQPEKPRMDETPSLEAPPTWPNGSKLLNHFLAKNVPVLRSDHRRIALARLVL